MNSTDFNNLVRSFELVTFIVVYITFFLAAANDIKIGKLKDRLKELESKDE